MMDDKTKSYIENKSWGYIFKFAAVVIIILFVLLALSAAGMQLQESKYNTCMKHTTTEEQKQTCFDFVYR